MDKMGPQAISREGPERAPERKIVTPGEAHPSRTDRRLLGQNLAEWHV